MHCQTPSPYTVWAPHARDVKLTLNGETLPLERRFDGWWQSTRLPAHLDRYGFLVDDEGPFPDPRSPSQPEGVHGLSEFIDHSRFRWSDAQWQARPLASAVIYELHVGTFSDAGTFDAAIA
jgi:maltooligosyltrehalose trehalohydrolase